MTLAATRDICARDPRQSARMCGVLAPIGVRAHPCADATPGRERLTRSRLWRSSERPRAHTLQLRFPLAPGVVQDDHSRLREARVPGIRPAWWVRSTAAPALDRRAISRC